MPLRPFHRPGAGLEYRLTVALALAGLVLVGLLAIQLLFPWLVAAAGIGAGVWCWRRHRAHERALHQVFYAQIAAHRGRISVLDFAIAAQITGSEARKFLDQRAEDFWGDFEPTPAGDVLYTFRHGSPAAVSPPSMPSAAGVTPDNFWLTAPDLAQRLSCTETDLAIRRSTPDLLHWSRDRDPDGCGWRYDAERDRYWPVLKF
ncbi:hypothetical protein IQ254_15595 [Nodosilinea sp. LEGE 07088]|uniref:hypothetical protein n=1 Tax=Nodosilinea sp. LEGE 07088 TaxID=2777968 RepID=UPI0018817204|nr:hypothetical protein [Nodosilinea sp. LEGE 07088]MBE9138597.1 hypothetical protein [Nodosilinea sp. LEGE 07088]